MNSFRDRSGAAALPYRVNDLACCNGISMGEGVRFGEPRSHFRATMLYNYRKTYLFQGSSGIYIEALLKAAKYKRLS